jgi:hypothetical protein
VSVFRADGPDVNQRHEAEHLQPFFGADEPRELPDDVGILGVASEGDERHAQVVADEEQHHLARLWRELKPVEHVSRHAHAFERVVVVAPLADVVQQQRQHEQFR